jgi:uncharacterized protein (TIRG00374 family)
MFRFSRLFMAGVVTAFAVWCALSVRTDISQLSFTSLLRSWDVALLAVTLTFLSYALRMTRWRWYLTRMGHSVPSGFSALAYIAGFAFTLSPGKVGELVRARYYTAIGIPLRDVVAAFWSERLMDLFSLLLLTLLVLKEFPRYRAVIWTGGVGIAIVASLVLLLPSQQIADFLKSRPRVPLRLVHATTHALAYLEVARSLLSPRPVAVGLLFALAAWALEGLGLGVLGSIFSPVHNDVSTTVGIYAVAVLVGALSFLPGGVGGTETVMTALLTSRGYSLAAALLTTLACRITTLWLGVGLGWAAVGLLRYGPQRETSG